MISDHEAGELAPGDRVLARDGGVDYQVEHVRASQGRVQVTDTNGDIHSYSSNQTLQVDR
jgi:pyruvate kinase